MIDTLVLKNKIYCFIVIDEYLREPLFRCLAPDVFMYHVSYSLLPVFSGMKRKQL